MYLSQELEFIVQDLIVKLPVLFACLGLLILAMARRNETRVPANYAIGGVVVIIVVQLVSVVVMPNLPRVVSFFVPGPFLGIAVTLVNFGLNAFFALGLLLLGAAVFMDRRKW
jgi:hypothetical protein